MQVLIGVELEPEQVNRLRDAFPDVDFRYAPDPQEAAASLSTCEVYFGNRRLLETISGAQKLRWIQTYSAGVNGLPMREMAERGILLTNASGAHGAQIAENILAMMLAFAVQIPQLVRLQEARKWDWSAIGERKFVLEGQRILICGLGGIGSALARKSKGLGLNVMGLRNRPVAAENVDEVVARDQLISALGRGDHVALCLPLTPETTRFLGERELRAMRPNAYVYNVGRGQSIEREALLRALSEGWIAGAGLDVTDPEPLQPDDPLWCFPNVILSQHTSGHAPDLDRRVVDIFADNLRRYQAGEPLRNLVDYGRGY